MREIAGQLSRWVDNARAATGKTSMFDRGMFTPPDNVYDEMRAARNAVKYDATVAGVVETTEAYAFQGVKWESPNADDADVFNQLARDQNLDSVIRAAWREEFTVGQVVAARLWGQRERDFLPGPLFLSLTHVVAVGLVQLGVLNAFIDVSDDTHNDLLWTRLIDRGSGSRSTVRPEPWLPCHATIGAAKAAHRVLLFAFCGACQVCDDDACDAGAGLVGNPSDVAFHSAHAANDAALRACAGRRWTRCLGRSCSGESADEAKARLDCRGSMKARRFPIRRIPSGTRMAVPDDSRSFEPARIPAGPLEHLRDAFLQKRPDACWQDLEIFSECIAVWLDRLPLTVLRTSTKHIAAKAYVINPIVVDAFVWRQSARWLAGRSGRGQPSRREQHTLPDENGDARPA
jgi:hypothetical protein